MPKPVLTLLAAAAVLSSAIPAPRIEAQPRAAAAAAMPAGFARAAERLLTARFPHNQPGAVAIVVKDGKTVFRRAYGLADLEFSVMLEPDMVFRVGSVTKQFTAAAILQLAERGALALEDEISRHLSDASDAWKGVTVRHLLTHTSGLPNLTAMPEWLATTPNDLTLSRLIALFKEKPLEFEPGSDFAYSNSGYLLLGAIIERLSGQSYADYMRQHVFVPLGMRQTFYDDPRRIVPRRARGYARQDGEWVNAGYLSMSHPHAAGAIASTVDDLAAWNTGLDKTRILSADAIDRMFTPYTTPAGRNTRYALGWMVDSHDGRPVAEHGGRIVGFTAHVLRLPADRLFVAVLANSEAADPSNAARRLAALALGRPIVDPPEVTLAEPTLDAYAGRYEEDGTRFEVRREGTRLRVLWKSRPPTTLAASAPDAFFEPNGVLRVTFGEDAAGTVDRVTLGGWGEERVARRVRQ